jgi:hypothetical protein
MTKGLESDSPYSQELPIIHIIRTSCHPASYTLSVGKGALSPVVKQQEHEADHWTSTSAEFKETDLLIHIHFLICLHGVVYN